MKDKIEFIGLVVRQSDGDTSQTLAFDLSGEDLKLKYEMSMETPTVDVTAFGDDSIYLPPPEQIDVSISGRRRSGADKLLVARIIKDGDAPFPPFEPSVGNHPV
jgi:hypothetical protein